jgi:hypothetical protein
MVDELKYLAVKNWEKYQVNRDGRHSSWIRDYVDKDTDPLYSRLSGAARYILDGCCRLRGRFGQNIMNDKRWIGVALTICERERKGLGMIIKRLVKDGFLIPTNEQLNILAAPIEEERREEKKKEPPTPLKGGKQEALFLLPNWVPQEAWEGFVEMRKKSRRPFTDRALKLAIKDLEKLRAKGYDPMEVLNQSVMKGWPGLYPVKPDGETCDDKRRKRTFEGLSRFLEKSGEVAGDIQRDDGPSGERDAG